MPRCWPTSPSGASCGGDGTCGKCRMVVESGSVDATVTAKLTAEEIERGYVLGVPVDRHR